MSEMAGTESTGFAEPDTELDLGLPPKLVPEYETCAFPGCEERELHVGHSTGGWNRAMSQVRAEVADLHQAVAARDIEIAQLRAKP